MSGKTHAVKLSPSGRAYLNIACGTRTHWSWNNVDFSPYARLRRHALLSRALRGMGLLSAARYAKLNGIDPEIVCWDVVSRGIPYEAQQFDALYHCHFIEHIPRERVEAFLSECLRVLKPGGVMRVVFPDLEQCATEYLSALSSAECDADAEERHRVAVHDLLHQLVATEANNNANERPLVRALERMVRGSARDIGWAHRWMYDRRSMRRLLTSAGFEGFTVLDPFKSGIAEFHESGLDVNSDGTPYYSKGTLHVEVRRPSRG